MGPFCGAPIRQIDHVTARADGGATSGANGNGTCTHCNGIRERAMRIVERSHEGGHSRTRWESRLGTVVSTSRPSLAGRTSLGGHTSPALADQLDDRAPRHMPRRM